MPALAWRVAAAILLCMQAAVLVLFSFFVLADGHMAAGRLEFFAAFVMVWAAALVLRGWLPAVIASMALCSFELVLGGSLFIVSAASLGALGLAGDLLSLAGPLVANSILALPTLVVLATATWLLTTVPNRKTEA